MKKIAIVCQPEYFRQHYETELAELWDFMEFPFNFSMSAEEFQPLLSFNPDLVFFFRGEFVPDSVLQALKGRTVAVSSEPFPRITRGRLDFTFDSLLRYSFFRAIRNKPFDYVFHYDASSLPVFEFDGLGISGTFPLPVPTSVYRPLSLPKRWDLCFFGRSTQHREKFFGPLKHYYNFLHVAHGMVGADLVSHVNASKICLNIHAEDEISWEPRMQVMLSTGAFVVSEPISDNKWLIPGEHFVEVKSPEEAREAVAHYLKNETARAEIARRGRERVLLTLECKQAFSSLVQAIAANQVERFRPGSSSTVVDCATGLVRLVARLNS